MNRSALDWALPFCIAAVVHGAVLLVVPHDLPACCLSPDSAGYIEFFARESNQALRTPGYPVFLWLMTALPGASLWTVLWAQVVLVSILAAVVGLLCREVVPELRHAGVWAGTAVATSFTGITLAHQVLSETLGALLVALCTFLAIAGAMRSRASWLWMAGACAAAAALVKPVLAVLALTLPAMAWLSAGDPRRLRSAILGATLLALSAPLGLSVHNQVRFGFFAPSMIGMLTAAEYLSAQVLATALSDPGANLLQETANARAEVRDLAERQPDPDARYRLYRQVVINTVSRYPSLAWHIAVSNVRGNAPWPFRAGELHKTLAHAVPPWVAWLNPVLYLLGAAGLWRTWRTGSGRVALALATTPLALALLTAITFAQGGRIMYPVEFVLFVFAGAALAIRRAT